MISIAQSRPLQVRLKQWFRAQTPLGWLALGISGATISFRVLSGELYMIPLYGFAAYAFHTLGQHWRKTPKPVRILTITAVTVLFAWAAMTSQAPAHALLFNKLYNSLKDAVSAWGINVPDIPNWMAQGLKMIALVIVVPVFVRLLRSRDGEEDETSRAFGKIMKVLVVLGLGDAVLSLFDI